MRGTIKRSLVVLPAVSALWFLSTVIIGGIAHPHYQHASQFISELGAIDAANGRLINLAGFIPTSLFLTAFVFLAITQWPGNAKKNLGLTGIGLYATTLCVAALYPCDGGCRPDNPSTSQSIHNLSAIFGYLSGILGVALLASDVKHKGNRQLGIIGYVLGSTALAMFFLLRPEFSLVGIAQRVFELSMYTWIILYSFDLQDEVLESPNH